MLRPTIEELDYRKTPLGELILRRRRVRSLDGAEVYEVKLAGQFLMSSLVNSAEIELATISLDRLNCAACDVLVGGLGLGHTVKAALDSGKVRSVTAIEYLAPVIDWFERRLVPLGASLMDDPRCRVIQGDFFRFLEGRPDDSVTDAVTAGQPERFHAVLLDIDHSPDALLHPSHADFYTSLGIERLVARLHPGGVFGMWSADPPTEQLLRDLRCSFTSVDVHESRFFHLLLNEENVNYIILAQVDGA